jgi:hypothetical protein
LALTKALDCLWANSGQFSHKAEIHCWLTIA